MLKNTPTTRRQPLDEHEWNFDDVPPGEIEACYLYEYAREFSKTNVQLQKFKKIWDDPAKEQSGDAYKVLRRAQDLLQTYCKNFPLIHYEYFPKIAWQDLTVWPKRAQKNLQENLRQRLAEDVNDWCERFRKSRFDRLEMATLRQLEPARIMKQEVQSVKRSCQSPGEQYAERLLREFEPPKDHLLTIFKNRHEWSPTRRVSGETEFGFFAIDWGYRDAEIRRAFGEWLEDQRQERKKLGLSDEKFVSSRGGATDKLKCLGALRVRNYYPRKDLVDYPSGRIKLGRDYEFAPYVFYPDLHKNAHKAEQEIAKIFPKDWSEKDFLRREAEFARYRKDHPLTIPTRTDDSIGVRPPKANH